MNKRTLIITILYLVFMSYATGQEKMPLDHSVYDDWKSVDNMQISNDGNLVVCEINPQQGDGKLIIINQKDNERHEFGRGGSAKISPTSEFILYKIKPQFDSIRKLTLAKVKKEKMPLDSLGIFVPKGGKSFKIANLEGYDLAKDRSNWMVLKIKDVENHKKNDSIANDTAKGEVNSKKVKKKKRKKSSRLVLMNPITGDSLGFSDLHKYSFSKNGSACAFIQKYGDSIDSVRISVYNTNKKKLNVIFTSAGYAENISIDDEGKQIAFTFSNDTAKVKAYSMGYFNNSLSKPVFIVDSTFSQINSGWSASEFGKIYFNENGDELYFGTAPKPEPESKDTLTKDEKVSVDIWNWKDLKLQPQQLKDLDKEKKRSYIAIFHTDNNKLLQLADHSLPTISIDPKAEGEISVGYDTKPYQRMSSWEASRYQDVYLINRETGTRELVLKQIASTFKLSPNQKYIVFYEIADSSWYAYDVNEKHTTCLTCEMEENFYYELNDIPNEPYPYGFCGWTNKNEAVIYDKTDLWMFDPTDKKAPVCLTDKYGSKNNIRFRYIKLDKEEVYLPKKMLLSAYDLQSKDDGFYMMSGFACAIPEKLVMGPVNFGTPVKAKDSDRILVTKSTFQVFPDVFLTDLQFKKLTRLTDANPQQSKYFWGNVELVNWITFEGDTMDGLLYTPEIIDQGKKYPMIVYFYERSSDRLHNYYSPRPIRSVINISYYVSNGYVVFVPDIKYREGYPGASAYDCVLSGTQSMVHNYGFIDRNNIGIQGQSWGGYQVAYLVTRTNYYKAAMAGAPVSNMTSAYGGIRWGSGLSRAFQYEQTQSRIGGNLWDKLPLYMENSPVFYLPRVETPLLIMHNDEDGAVPWYQGIELFNGLRRLDKPVWMLVYNGGPHNLKRRADCKDLTIRMQQFFDHYLKGEPAPVWMEFGIPAIDKGKEFGFELVD